MSFPQSFILLSLILAIRSFPASSKLPTGMHTSTVKHWCYFTLHLLDEGCAQPRPFRQTAKIAGGRYCEGVW